MASNDLATLPEDPAAFAGELQKLASTGDFNPFSLLAGTATLQAVVVAPFPPAMVAARTRFLTDGTGPLADTVQQLIKQGAPPGEAATYARMLFQQAQGMLVVVLGSDHGVMTIPQLFFGHFSLAWREQAVAACGQGFAHAAALDAAIRQLETVAAHGRRFPHLVAGPTVSAPASFWPALAAEVLATAEDSLFAGGQRERLADLAHWCGAACAQVGLKPDASRDEMLARIHLLAGESDRACAVLERLEGPLVAGDGDEDAYIEAVHHLVDAAIKLGRPAPVAAWLGERADRIDAVLGGSYDLALALVKLAAAAGDGIGPACDRLVRRNRKLARHDLTREPIWRVVAEPADLIDTAEAAAVLDRPLAWLTKRLEQGSIPHHVRPAAQAGGAPEIRLPRAALIAWKTAMDAHKLLD